MLGRRSEAMSQPGGIFSNGIMGVSRRCSLCLTLTAKAMGR
jgi:hypothetical protein